MSTKTKNTRKNGEQYISRIIKKTVSQTTKDLADWRAAKRQASNVLNPKRIKLIELMLDIYQDPLVTSQVEQRIERSMSAPWRIVKADTGELDEETNTKLHDSVGFSDIMYLMFECPHWGHSLVELDNITGITGVQDISATLLPRQNVMPQPGILLLDCSKDQGINYRETREYGVTLLEFGDTDDFGLLNKAIPLALFKRFAERCWSQLCEIYGIPPRYLKTDTQDPAMLDRAEAMMRDLGAAAWFIIDTTEEFNFAQGISTNGDVYKNAIDLYNSEMSLLFSGAQLGQDTKNGNRSKEEVGITLLDKKAAADRRLAESYINTKVLPALYLLGFVPDGIKFEWETEQDDEELWSRTVAVLPYYDVEPSWLKDKFGIEVTGKRESVGGAQLSLPPTSSDFFG